MAKNHLENINNPADLRKLSVEELRELAKEIREFIIDIVSVKRGHLGASLGVVELTLALHYVFDTPDDLLVWDVGHQAYPHKIITGRKDVFHTNRQLGGISGFPNRSESPFDPFGTGHSSTSISAVLGMAIASKLAGDLDRNHVAVIGDASIASGMAFEGMNHAGVTKTNMLVVLNDNEMGIDPNVGALKNYLTSVKSGMDAHQKNVFEALDFMYAGPVDGHDLEKLINELQRLKAIKGPKFLHVITKKGKGLTQAEVDQITYHAPGHFDKFSGELIKGDERMLPPKFQDVFGKTLVELAEMNQRIIGITPAMPTGSSMKFMLESFPDRAFDVGIAEQHAVTMSAGLASQGMIPFCVVYSTFLQRAYDQIIHDVALQRLPVIFCVDRAGLVGEDGATHHGVFDMAFLRCIPNLSIVSPMDEIELRNMMYTAQLGIENPLVIRYPRGRGSQVDWQRPMEKIELGKGRKMIEGTDLAVLAIGAIGLSAIKVIQEMEEEIAFVDMRSVKPLDQDLLTEVFENYRKILVIEEGCLMGGFGSAVLEFAHDRAYSNKTIERMGIGDDFVEHGTNKELLRLVGLGTEKIEEVIRDLLRN